MTTIHFSTTRGDLAILFGATTHKPSCYATLFTLCLAGDACLTVSRHARHVGNMSKKISPELRASHTGQSEHHAIRVEILYSE